MASEPGMRDPRTQRPMHHRASCLVVDIYANADNPHKYNTSNYSPAGHPPTVHEWFEGRGVRGGTSVETTLVDF